jgi:hypothetical protein
MDPVGFSIGVVGLASLVSTLIQGIQLIRSNDAFDRDTQILFRKLNIERELLIQWAHSCGLLKQHRIDGSLFGPDTDRVIYETLEEIAILLAEAAKLQGKYLPALREYDGRPTKYDVDRRKVGLRRKFMFAIDGKSDVNYIIGELEYFVGKLPQLVPSIEHRRAMREDLVLKDCDARYIRLNLADHRVSRGGDRQGQTRTARRSTDDIVHSLNDSCKEKHHSFRHEKSRPRPPPSYSQSELSYYGERTHRHRDDADLESSIRSRDSRQSRQSSSDAAREMWGDLLGRNGSRRSGYSPRR